MQEENGKELPLFVKALLLLAMAIYDLVGFLVMLAAMGAIFALSLIYLGPSFGIETMNDIGFSFVGLTLVGMLIGAFIADTVYRWLCAGLLVILAVLATLVYERMNPGSKKSDN